MSSQLPVMALDSDANRDGIVNASDAIILTGEWLQTGNPNGGGDPLWSTNGTDVFRLSGRVGIGTATPTSVLDVRGEGKFSKLDVRSMEGQDRVKISIPPGGHGYLSLLGPNGNDNIRLTSLDANNNHGWLGICDTTGAPKGMFFVNAAGQSTLIAEISKMVMDYPGKTGEKIVYTSMAVPEPTLCLHGVVRLNKGRAAIELPEHFRAVAAPNSLTVQLTPGSMESRGIGFEITEEGHIMVGELNNGTGEYDVHYVAYARRAGFENYRSVIPEKELKSISGTARE